MGQVCPRHQEFYEKECRWCAPTNALLVGRYGKPPPADMVVHCSCGEVVLSGLTAQQTAEVFRTHTCNVFHYGPPRPPAPGMVQNPAGVWYYEKQPKYMCSAASSVYSYNPGCSLEQAHTGPHYNATANINGFAFHGTPGVTALGWPMGGYPFGTPSE